MAKLPPLSRTTTATHRPPVPSVLQLQQAFSGLRAAGVTVHLDADGVKFTGRHAQLGPDSLSASSGDIFDKGVEVSARWIARAYAASKAFAQVSAYNRYGYDVEWTGVSDGGEFLLLLKDRRPAEWQERVREPEVPIRIDAHYPAS
jgi:hypothetical protein